MKFDRASGILLHPTSLPGPYGIGDLGPEAYRWIDFLYSSGCRLWQILPLGPTGYGDSPYQCFSAFAGNPYLISPDGLVEMGLLSNEELSGKPDFSSKAVDFGLVIPWKLELLDKAYGHFQTQAEHPIRQAYEEFRTANAAWLEDFALFMALKDAHRGAPWVQWEAPLRDRSAEALELARKENQAVVELQIFRQFIFFSQWRKLRAYANDHDIRIIGDIPIFVAHDSADVWANPGLFYLNKKGQPTVVAGVPPDYFSSTGQLWGNPLYRWDIHRQSKYSWWISRLRAVLGLVDIVRLDHFRGFSGYWEVPGDAPTAETGRWVDGPGRHFFKAVRKELGELPIIAEDLGVITPAVEALRDEFNLPGMKILQFAFAGGPIDPFLPHNYPENCVVYTGTHDNDTARGWYERVPEAEKDFYRRYLARDGSNVSWDLLRACWGSVAMFSLAPMQDFLNLDNSARMNYPGRPSGNWTWRMPAGSIDTSMSNRIHELNFLYLRMPYQPDVTNKAGE